MLMFCYFTSFQHNPSYHRQALTTLRQQSLCHHHDMFHHLMNYHCSAQYIHYWSYQCYHCN